MASRSKVSLCLPSSPNWFCSKATDFSRDGVLAFGSRRDVVLLRLPSRDDDGAAAFNAEYEATLSGLHSDRVSGLCFSPCDGSLLASVGDDLRVNLTDVRALTTALLHDVHQGKPTCVTWARVRDVVDYIVSGDEKGAVVVCNVASKKTKYWSVAGAKAGVTSIAGCPHAQHLVAVGYKTGLVTLLDLHEDVSAVRRFCSHDGEVQALCWAPFEGAGHFTEELGADDTDRSERLLASSSSDCTIKVWSTVKGLPLASFTSPVNLGVPRWKQSGEKKGLPWVTVAWPESRPDVLVSGSHTGVLLTWDLLRGGQHRWSVLGPKDHRSHARTVFNVACFGNVACTTSMDRQIIFWNIAEGSREAARLSVLPGLSGFVYALSFSPVNSGLLALACGDSLIRTWNVASAADPYDVTSFWQGIRSKVTALCWHPVKEGVLAYGTEEGRVGIYNVLVSKPPTVLVSFHAKTVYAVSWGPACPACPARDLGHNPSLRLYSCGNGAIFVHDPGAPEKAAANLNKLMSGCSSRSSKATRTEIAWNSNFDLLSIGNSDGTVEVYSSADLRLLLLVSSQSRLVHCVRWHPEFTLSSSTLSRFRFWMAVATQDSVVHLHDLSAYLEGVVSEEPVEVTTCDVQLVGHGSSVASLAWNPHLDGQLLTASFDSTVRVWDAAAGRTTACFSGHSGRVLTAAWNPLDPDAVFSGGEDFTVKAWKISEQDVEPSARVLEEVERARKKQAQRKKSRKAAVSKVDTKPDAESDDHNVQGPKSAVLDESVRTMLELRKQELLLQNEASSPQPPVSCESPKGDSDVEEAPEADSEATQRPRAVKNAAPSSGKKKKKRNEKSLFPITSALENRGKAYTLVDCLALTDQLTAEPARAWDEARPHLGLYTDRVGAYRLLKSEADNHLSGGNLENALHLEIWKGNISGALKTAAKNEQLNDWLVSMAVAVSPTFWSEMCLLYVKQLVGAGLPQKAVAYLLAQNKVHEAIDVLKVHSSYKEALVLAKVRLPPNDPFVAQLMDEWAAQYEKEGNAECAAKCYLAAGQPEKAASVLSQRTESASIRAGAYVASKFGDGPRASLYASKGIFNCMVDKDFGTAEKLLHDHPQLKPYSHVVRVFRRLLDFFAADEGALDFDFAAVRLMFDETRHRKSSDSMDEKVPPLAGGERQSEDGLELEEWEACLGLCPAIPVPQQESHIVPWISVMLSMGCADLAMEKTADCVRRVLTVFAVLHKSGNVARLMRFKRLMSPADDLAVDVTGLTDSEQNLSESGEQALISLRAYMGLSSIHRLVDSEEKLASAVLEQAEKVPECVCLGSSAELARIVGLVLNEERAELSLLNTRLTYTKVALASISASRKRVEASAPTSVKPAEEPAVEPDVREEPNLAEIPADTLIAQPGVTLERLQAECDRLEGEIAAGFADRFQVELFPNPLGSAILLTDFCLLHQRRCGCEDSARLSETVADFGRKYSALDKQMTKFDQLRGIFSSETSA